MTHAPFHELLALRLYDELSPEEADVLTQHLEGCEPCRTFARELETTLGALRPPTSRRNELPPDWRAHLARRLTGERRRSWTRAASVFAAGLAAGALLVSALSTSPANPPAAEHVARFGAAPPFVPSSTPPPPATSRGALAHLGSWLRR